MGQAFIDELGRKGDQLRTIILPGDSLLGKAASRLPTF